MPISYSEASWTGMLDFRTCSWNYEALRLVETCPGVTQYVGPLEKDDEGDQDDIELLPPLMNFDAPLPFLREGIPRYNDDGSANAYWEKWPEFRSHMLRLFLGIAEGAGEFRGDVRNVLVANGTALERNALGRQILADSSSMDVIVDGDSAEEGTSRGVAMMLAASL
jgi:hypothetical protein